MRRLLIGGLVFCLSLAAPIAANDQARDRAADALLVELDVGDNVSDGRDLLAQVLATEAFHHEPVGPFDVYALEADGLSAREAKRTVKDAVKCLEPLVDVLERHFTRELGVVSGRRFPILLTESGEGESGFSDLLAVIDRCEDLGCSGWKPANTLWTPQNRAAEVARTWEVQVFNLAHPTIADRRKAFFQHGLGYYTAAHVVNRLLRRGSWGMVPPWLAHGLIDEFDIEAYGEAWVGGEWFQYQKPGWSRPGWSGFVPKGARPPAPVKGPPAALAVTVKKTGDSWARRSNSGDRHWGDLVTDRKSEAPASFGFMAEHESFLPRDRAYARCVVHALVTMMPEDGPSLIALLDDGDMRTPSHGMPEAEPLTLVVARALGGLPEVEDTARLPLGEQLERLGKPHLAETLESLGAERALEVADHRGQSRWLYRKTGFAMDARTKIFNVFLEAEYYEQLEDWKAIGRALDAGAEAMFAESKRYPKRPKDRAKVVEAFRGAFTTET